ncbi:radical SAM protein [Candidatus Bathyarchaeota archaeon]|nr:MAG: radical SAM protein [Candidatus Bathyarchaeota archaeon]
MWQFIRPDAVRILKDEKCKASLLRYFKILAGKNYAKFLLAKKFPAKFSLEDSTEKLWRLHDQLIEGYRQFEKKVDKEDVKIEDLPQPDQSFFDLKIELAKRIMENCHFCTRRCGVNRFKGELGFCRCGDKIVVSTYFEHLGEESELVPSGTIFTCGCTMRCLHCQNWTISQWYEEGEKFEVKELAEIVERLWRSGCRNANLVGGDPTPWLKHWLEVFKEVNVNVPVVWNSNSYYSEETAKILAGFVDVYLLDFKYGKNDCAVKISNAPNYVEVCQRNHLYALNHGELIIRILVLPQHVDCCTKPILKWIAENLGTWVRVNLMDQYRPEWKAYEIPELRRRLIPSEFREAVNYAKSLGITNLA